MARGANGRPRLGAVVIGAGPGGLATSRELTRRGVPHVVVERGRLAANWRACYDSLRLHTGKHLSALPGRKFPREAPLFPSRDDLIRYLEEYARAFGLPIREGVAAVEAVPVDAGWRVGLEGGETLEASAVVIATGIMSNPHEPEIAGRDGYRGRVLHSVAYKNPDGFRGRRVLVVGVGNSGAEIASELGRAGVDVTISIRSGANVVPLTLFGMPIQYFAWLIRPLPRPAREAIAAAVRRIGDARRGPPPFPRPAHSALDSIPLIGFRLVDAIREGLVAVRGAPAAFTPEGVRFEDGPPEPFDDVILATGFRPALGVLGDRVRTDARGFALRTDRVRSADLPGLFFVGHNYDSTGGLRNIYRDAPLAARAVAAIAR